jgi:hypothetical protein
LCLLCCWCCLLVVVVCFGACVCCEMFGMVIHFEAPLLTQGVLFVLLNVYLSVCAVSGKLSWCGDCLGSAHHDPIHNLMYRKPLSQETITVY